MFEPARSFHSPAVKPSMAHLDAAYAVSRGGETLADIDDTLTIVPPPWASMCGMAASVVHTLARKLTRMRRSTSSAVTS